MIDRVGKRDPHKILKLLIKEFPGWVSWEFFGKKYPFESIFLSDLERLDEQGFLDSEIQTYPKNLAKKEWVTRKVYRLSQNGFGFLTNLKAIETNNLILNLTYVLVLLGFGAMFNTLAQTIIQFLK